MTDFDSLFSERAALMRASEIRELLKLTQKPDIISLAGGLPDPAAFPAQEVAEIAKDICTHDSNLLQYSTTEGHAGLREKLVERMAKKDIHTQVDHLVITTASQQSLDLLGKLFINRGDTIIVGAPTYLGAIGAFNTYLARYESATLDNDGMRMDLLEEKLKDLKNKGVRPKFVYTVPTFQNPAGVTMSESRRKRLVELAYEHDFVVIEDDPYGELRYSGEPVKPIKAFDEENSKVVHLGTFSKILAPGFRLGWVCGPHDFVHKFVIAKQSTDLCTGAFVQNIAYEFISRGLLDPHIEKIKRMYGEKRDTMVSSMEKYFPKEAEFTRPEGGMFAWATLPEHIDTKEMLPAALEKRVAYVISQAFYYDRSKSNSMRLNFSHASNENIEEGIKRLSEVMALELEAKRKLDKGVVIGV